MATGIGQHLYKEMLAAMDRRPIRDAITRQAPIAQQWIEDSIKSSGVDATADMVEDLIEMNGIYEGTKPIFNQLIDFCIELDSHGIERGSAKFHAQVRGSADHGSMDGFFIKNGEIHPYNNPDREPEFINEAEDVKTPEHPLRQSWDSAVERYKEGEASGDQFAMDSAERMLDRLRAQITAAPIAVAKPEPVKAPDTPVQAPDDGFQARSDSLDARLDALPDHNNYTLEQQHELEDIESDIDQLNTDMDNDPYYADEDYG